MTDRIPVKRPFGDSEASQRLREPEAQRREAWEVAGLAEASLEVGRVFWTQSGESIRFSRVLDCLLRLFAVRVPTI